MRISSYKGRVLAPFDPWRSSLCTCPFKLSLNPYTGCSFKCLYCYATAYIGQKDSEPKKDFIKRLRRDIVKYPPNIPINIGTSSDPYPPEEVVYRLTRSALELLIPLGRKILITTKGTLYAKRDLDIIPHGNVAVTPTITTLDPRISLLIEPGAPLPEARLEAMSTAASHNVPIGVRIDPIIPLVNDDPYDIERLVEHVASSGAQFIVTSTYKARPDNFRRLLQALGSSIGAKLAKLYSNGPRIQGYRYLPKQIREKLLEPVIRAAVRNGLEYATCREGLTGKKWFNAKSCDGTHLIPEKIRPKQTVHSLNKFLTGAGTR